jgi:membrane-associated protease RseP (regulator of RpoE activity)
MSDSTPPANPAYDLYRPVEVIVVSRAQHRYWLHALLLVVTGFTTLVMGARLQYNFVHNVPAFSMEGGALSIFPVTWALQGSNLLMGVPFALTLMLILLTHEMGHYFYCVRYGVNATLPFFIPAPTLIGTLGAFIKIKSPIRSRAQLFDIGIAGPIAGFVAATVTLLFALPLSKPLMDSAAYRDFGLPLIFTIVHGILGAVGLVSAGSIDNLTLHPTAIAAWVGMFATALNLLPGGQLDGGHIVYALSPHRHRWVSRITITALILLVWFWYGWAIWAALLTVSGMRHPQVAPWPHLKGRRRWLALLALVLLVLTFVPEPFPGAGLRASLLGVGPR